MNHFAKITESLETQGLDAMLLTCEANRFYASGFHSSGTDGIALVTRRHNYYFTDNRYTEAAARSVQNAEIREANRQHPYSALINAVIDAEGLKRIGYEDEYVTVADWRRYTEKLHGELVPASALLRQLRAVKDAEERDCLIQAQRIAERALTETLNDIRPGVPEREIAALLLYRMLHYGAEDKSFDPIVVSGPNTSMPHGVPGDRVLQKGDFVTMDFGCKYRGYCSDMTRTVALGTATEQMREVYEVVLQAQLAGIAATRAGLCGQQIDAAARRVITEAGFGEYFGHGYGHSLGLEIHEAPYCNQKGTTPFPARAVCSSEPGIYLPGNFGVRIEDVVVFTDDGCTVLTNSPKELLIL